MHSSSRVLDFPGNQFGEDRLRQREAGNIVAELRDEELEVQKKLSTLSADDQGQGESRSETLE